MAFKGKDLVRSKICINNTVIEQVNTCRYLGTDVSYMGKVDVGRKVVKFQRVTGMINCILPASSIRRDTRIHVYNTFALPMLMYLSLIHI